jgi:hypothetical protein
LLRPLRGIVCVSLAGHRQPSLSTGSIAIQKPNVGFLEAVSATASMAECTSIGNSTNRRGRPLVLDAAMRR